jgi:hypothetical protein
MSLHGSWGRWLSSVRRSRGERNLLCIQQFESMPNLVKAGKLPEWVEK